MVQRPGRNEGRSRGTPFASDSGRQRGCTRPWDSDQAERPNNLPVMQHGLCASAGRCSAPSKDSWSGEGLCIGTDQEARRAALTYKNGYTCHVCGEDFERRGLLVEHMATHPPDVVPTVEKRPKRPREDDTADDGNALKCPWCAKKYTAHAWLRKHMLQKHRRSSCREEAKRLKMPS
ncbi:putative Zinc finger C2H2 type [Trypanosoma vivax]|nr:putative Zinc finger C2H2 type [Trypanosoma vivax]